MFRRESSKLAQHSCCPSKFVAQTRSTSAKHCYSWRTAPLFLPAVSGMVGKGLERETLLPFPRLRRFGTHSETGSKFLLLFSIKSKENTFVSPKKFQTGEQLIFTKKICSANALNQCEALLFLAHRAFFSPCRFRHGGEGFGRETLLPFPRLRRFGTHSETGSKFLLLFSIKSKGESPCFAEKVLNWRSTDVAQEKLCANAPF